MQTMRLRMAKLPATKWADIFPFEVFQRNASNGGSVRRPSSASFNSNAASLGCGCIQYRHFSWSPSNNDGVAGEGLQRIKHIDLNLVEHIESVQQTGKVAVLFSDAPPVLWTVDVLCAIKDLPGMTWVSTIVLSTLILRAIVGVPIAIAQNKAMARLEGLKPEIKKLGEELKRETALAVKKFKWDEKTTRIRFTRSYKKHWRRMVEENNCHPMKTLALSLTQLPVWICFSSALRNVVYAVPLPRTTDKTDRWVQIYNESTPWAGSLVLPDPVVFPAIFLVMNFLNIEFNRRQRLLNALPETKFQKALPWVMRGGIIGIAFIATSVPSAVSMYWATSTTLALVQNLILSRPQSKRLILKSSTPSTG